MAKKVLDDALQELIEPHFHRQSGPAPPPRTQPDPGPRRADATPPVRGSLVGR